MTSLTLPHERTQIVRWLCAAIAAVVVVDVVDIGAPGLALMAVPFVVAAFRYTHGTMWGSALVAMFAALYAALGVNYAIANGIDAPFGDLLFAYVGTPLAVMAAAVAVRQGLAAHQTA